MQTNSKVREPAVAGLFYSKNKDTLVREVAMFLENSHLETGVEYIYGLVAPHAGYMYSGGVAARSYRQIVDRQYDTIVVISPSHREYFREISVYSGIAYRTPLGDIAVNREISQALADEDERIRVSQSGHDIDEHALEVQLPFLQHILDNFKLVPVIMGNQDQESIDILASALGTVLADKKALIVASSDLSHYHRYEKAVELDRHVVDHINRYDEDMLLTELNRGACEMCGGGPVIATMKASRLLGANKSKVLIYRNSGDVSGERNQVVGYLAAMLYH